MRLSRPLNRKTSFILFLPIVIIAIVIDRLSKAWAAGALALGTQSGPNLGLVRLTMVHNEGAAFGLGQGNQWAFVIIAAVILAWIVGWLLIGKKHGKVEVVSLALIAAGAVGNVIDRVQQGYVVDFFEFTFFKFPVFNVADICITCGVVLFVICVLFFMDWDEDKGKNDSKALEGEAVVAAAAELGESVPAGTNEAAPAAEAVPAVEAAVPAAAVPSEGER